MDAVRFTSSYYTKCEWKLVPSYEWECYCFGMFRVFIVLACALISPPLFGLYLKCIIFSSLARSSGRHHVPFEQTTTRSESFLDVFPLSFLFECLHSAARSSSNNFSEHHSCTVYAPFFLSRPNSLPSKKRNPKEFYFIIKCLVNHTKCLGKVCSIETKCLRLF